jgi:hypothetical protein
MNKLFHATIGLLAFAPVATAQVGHNPDQSPYADITTNRSLNFHFSVLGGDGGLAGVGPRNGRLASASFNIRMGTPTEVYFSLGVGEFDRTVIDPNNGTDTRLVDETTNRMTFFGVGLNWQLTGKKTWHKLAPYVGFGTGFSVGGTIASDPGAFGFTGKFYAAPTIGVAWHATSRLLVRFEARDTLWKLTYPPLYFLEPANLPGGDPVLDPAVISDSQWTHQPTFTIGLGYSFRY